MEDQNYTLKMNQCEYVAVSYAIKLMLASAEKAELKVSCHKLLSTAMVLQHRLCSMGKPEDGYTHDKPAD